MIRLYLSRRNLLALLKKLDGVKEGIPSACSIVKRDTTHPDYPSTTNVQVTAVEDEDYYTDRSPGVMRDE